MRIAARLFLTLVAVAALLPLERTAAQAVYGSIYGTVTDSSGAAVPGATVTITDLAKNITINETTNDLGYFNRAKLVLGRYRVEIQKEGFKTAVQEDVAVNVDVSTQLTIVLQAGTVTEQVTVTAEAPMLKATAQTSPRRLSKRSSAIYRPSIATSPASSFSRPVRHAAVPDGITPPARTPRDRCRFSINGQHFSGTSYQLDGTDNRDRSWNHRHQSNP
jgi:hypothetical protein